MSVPPEYQTLVFGFTKNEADSPQDNSNSDQLRVGNDKFCVVSAALM